MAQTSNGDLIIGIYGDTVRTQEDYQMKAMSLDLQAQILIPEEDLVQQVLHASVDSGQSRKLASQGEHAEGGVRRGTAFVEGMEN